MTVATSANTPETIKPYDNVEIAVEVKKPIEYDYSIEHVLRGTFWLISILLSLLDGTLLVFSASCYAAHHTRDVEAYLYYYVVALTPPLLVLQLFVTLALTRLQRKREGLGDNSPSITTYVFGAFMIVYCCAVFSSFIDPVDVAVNNTNYMPWDSDSSFKPPAFIAMLNSHPQAMALYVLFMIRTGIPMVLAGSAVLAGIGSGFYYLFRWALVDD